MNKTIDVFEQENHSVGQFFAMASTCEILVDSRDTSLTRKLTQIAAEETWRIQDKFSRYNPNSLCSKINQSNGQAVAIDQETFQLLEFADQCYLMTEGLFDITSGVLRQVWQFDGSDKLPADEDVRQTLQYIGWHKIDYDRHNITLRPNMEVDFGGIGKEYAVDKVVDLLRQAAPNVSILVNFGGDLAISKTKPDNSSWTIGIENPTAATTKTALTIKKGALATSGDANRYLIKDGKRYGHILNPKTGRPIEKAPRSITVAAPQCLFAGMLCTMALLHGADAEAFLQAQDVEFWCYR